MLIKRYGYKLADKISDLTRLQIIYLSQIADNQRRLKNSKYTSTTLKELAEIKPLMIHSGMNLEEMMKRTEMIREITKHVH